MTVTTTLKSGGDTSPPSHRKCRLLSPQPTCHIVYDERCHICSSRRTPNPTSPQHKGFGCVELGPDSQTILGQTYDISYHNIL